jgi:flagellar biosynthesis protein FliP
MKRALGMVVALVLLGGVEARGQGRGPVDASDPPGAAPAVALPGPLADLPELSVDGINPISVLAGASRALPGAGGSAEGTGGRGGLSTAVNILVVLTVLALAPSIMLMTTCFMRVLIVLGLLKQALGTQTVPPPQVTTALALFMTLLVMTPTLERINAEAIVPYRAGQVTDYDQLWTRARQPMRDFMFDQIEATGNWSSLYMVMEYRGQRASGETSLTRADVDMVTLVPAYMLSELKVAFLMGFKVYLPFLVIDMVVSTMLIAMGMMMLPPVLISLPFKLLLFVLVDGWVLVVGGLMNSFVTPHEVGLALPALQDAVLAWCGPPGASG